MAIPFPFSTFTSQAVGGPGGLPGTWAIAVRVDASELIRKIDRMSALGTDSPAVLRRGYLEAGRIYMADMRRQFDANSAGGPGWAPLRPSTQRKKGGDFNRLVERGNLRRSLNDGDPNQILEATANGVRCGSREYVGAFHQQGTINMVRRPFIVRPSASANERMKEAIKSAIRQSIIVPTNATFAALA